MFPEQLIALAKPGLVAPGTDLSAQDLVAQTLLHLQTEAHQRDWHRLLQRSGVAPPRAYPRHRFQSFAVYTHALRAGAGIGLGWGWGP